MTSDSIRVLWSLILCLGGASVAIFVTGQHDVAAMAAAALGAGMGMLVGLPTRRPASMAIILSALFVLASASALLPASDGLPGWRRGAPDVVVLGELFAAMPAHTFFWWLVLGATVVTAWFILACPLDTPSLRIFLHVVAGVVAAYSVVSIVQAAASWDYPFSGGANFGLLPNRNHTAALLVLGSVISFGLMQWEVARGFRLGGVVSAVCGAPCLAGVLFFSTSRAGVLFLALGLVLWAAGATGQAVNRRTMLTAAAILAAFLLGLFFFGGSTVQNRLAALWTDALAMEAESDGGPRVIDFRQPVFRDTVDMITDTPWTGQGLGHFEFVFPHYREASRTAARVLHPESDWLMVAAESGLPALLLLFALVSWYFATCWRGRRGSGGLLRWTVASAIGAVLAHGVIDVPWHRPALGWFLLVVALVALSPDRPAPARPCLWRRAQVAWGILLLSVATYAGWAGSTSRPPLVYRWSAYMEELKGLLEARKYDDGEFVAREAIRDFPLEYQSYYWRAGFLRMFDGTDREMEADMAAGRYVEPVLPWVPAQQAKLWEGINDRREAEAFMEAIRRAALIQESTRTGELAAAELERSLRATSERPGVQVELRLLLENDPVLLAQWVRLAQPQLADEFLTSLGAEADLWLDGLPSEARGQLLGRWISLPSAPKAVAYMEARNAMAAGAYNQLLAAFYASAGNKERAVRLVAEAEGLALVGGMPDGEFSHRLAELERQGNPVAVRRLVREAVQAKEADTEELQVAMTWYAAAGDWEMAWKAASRLVTETKSRQ